MWPYLIHTLVETRIANVCRYIALNVTFTFKDHALVI